MAPKQLRLNGVTAIHIGEHMTDTPETAEKRLRPMTAPPAIDFVLLVEGIGVAELAAATADLIGAVSNTYSGRVDTGLYRLAYLLDAAE